MRVRIARMDSPSGYSGTVAIELVLAAPVVLVAGVIVKSMHDVPAPLVISTANAAHGPKASPGV